MADSLLTQLDDNQASHEDRESLLNKWKDKPQEELLEAKVNSDLYVRTLTARLDDLRKDYLELREQHQAGTELKELIDQLKSKPQGDDTSHNTNQGNTQPAIKPEDIETLVNQRISEQLTAHQKALAQKENFNTVQAKLKEHFGSDYQNAYKQRLDTLGLSHEFADDLAKNHPAVFMKTFELDTPKAQSLVSLPKSNQRPTSFAPSAVKRDWNYYQEMKKTNPKLYLDPKIAVQMDADAQALGDDFGMPMN